MIRAIMTQTRSSLYTSTIRGALLCGCLMLSGCVYRIDIQQGNLLEQEAIDQVTVGMSQSAVQFLLGTPTVADPFHESRWDYPYYMRFGRSKDIERRWIAVEVIGQEPELTIVGVPGARLVIAQRQQLRIVPQPTICQTRNFPRTHSDIDRLCLRHTLHAFKR